jgi:hypothetical protein
MPTPMLTLPDATLRAVLLAPPPPPKEDIDVGQELLVSYGPGYHGTHFSLL